MTELTTGEIREDINVCGDRIELTRARLSRLPSLASSKDRKKIRTRRRELGCELEHCKRLIVIAERALEENHA